MKKQKPSVLRILLGALKYGSWQLSCEIESERVLFPKAYELRKKKEAELRRWVKYELQKEEEKK